MNYIIVIGLFQALITGLLFFISRKNKGLDSLLLTLLVFVFAHLAMKFSIFVLMDNAILKQRFNTFTSLGYGPVLWMIARKAEDPKYIAARNWFLLIPMAVAGFFYLSIAAYIAFTGTVPAATIDRYNDITLMAIFISSLSYAVLTLRISSRFKEFWRTEQKMVRALSLVYLSMTFVMIYGFALQWLRIDGGLSCRILGYTNLLLICVVILRYRMTAQTELSNAEAVVDASGGLMMISSVFDAPVVALAEATNAPEPEDIYGNEHLLATVSDAVAEPVPARHKTATGQLLIVVQKLSALMQAKKAFRDPDLDLKKLSELSGISKHLISEALNHAAEKTFYQFLNEHRIEEVLLLLDKCKQNAVKPNILSLAFDVGFNSKSTFNLYFKKATGFTPSEYLKV